MDIEKLIPIAIIAIVTLSRLFGKKKEEGQDRPHVPPPPRDQPPPVQQPPNKKEKSFLETIIDEVERQKELNKPKPSATEIRQKSYKVERKPKPKRPVEFLPSQYGGVEQTEPIDHLEKEEGVSSIPEKYKRASLAVETEQERKIEFDPREAFRLKTLLERPEW